MLLLIRWCIMLTKVLCDLTKCNLKSNAGLFWSRAVLGFNEAIEIDSFESHKFFIFSPIAILNCFGIYLFESSRFF